MPAAVLVPLSQPLCHCPAGQAPGDLAVRSSALKSSARRKARGQPQCHRPVLRLPRTSGPGGTALSLLPLLFRQRLVPSFAPLISSHSRYLGVLKRSFTGANTALPKPQHPDFTQLPPLHKYPQRGLTTRPQLLGLNPSRK